MLILNSASGFRGLRVVSPKALNPKPGLSGRNGRRSEPSSLFRLRQRPGLSEARFGASKVLCSARERKQFRGNVSIVAASDVRLLFVAGVRRRKHKSGQSHVGSKSLETHKLPQACFRSKIGL